MSTDYDIIRAALLITRATSRYSRLAWICEVRAAVRHKLPARRVDELLIELHRTGQIVLERADLVQGVAQLAEASVLRDETKTETWHYAGLPGVEAE